MTKPDDIDAEIMRRALRDMGVPIHSVKPHTGGLLFTFEPDAQGRTRSIWAAPGTEFDQIARDWSSWDRQETNAANVQADMALARSLSGTAS